MKPILLATSALIADKREERRSEYEASFAKVRSMRELLGAFYILETVSDEPGFLSGCGADQVFCSRLGNQGLRNKGVKEFTAIRAFLNAVPLPSDSMVIKLTGRYLLLDESFIRRASSFGGDFMYLETSPPPQMFTGCFACRANLMDRFVNSVNFEKMEWDMKNVEAEMYEFSLPYSCEKVREIGILANINNCALVRR